jgi:hypothetical protein
VTLELHIQPPDHLSYARMLWSHPHLGCEPGQTEAQELDGFLWTPNQADCFQCGKPTCWVDLDFEGPLHPGRCSERAWDLYRWAEMKASWEEHKDEWIAKAKGEARQEPSD